MTDVFGYTDRRDRRHLSFHTYTHTRAHLFVRVCACRVCVCVCVCASHAPNSPAATASALFFWSWPPTIRTYTFRTRIFFHTPIPISGRSLATEDFRIFCSHPKSNARMRPLNPCARSRKQQILAVERWFDTSLRINGCFSRNFICSSSFSNSKTVFITVLEVYAVRSKRSAFETRQYEQILKPFYLKLKNYV
jgi:hypothetical protein